jgi:hypothetical protein
MKDFGRNLWIVTFCSSLIGVFFLFVSFRSTDGLFVAANCARAVAFAVIPYCLARATIEAKKENSSNIKNDK